MLTAGRRLGPYEIVSRIGAGGMGEVFKARDTRLDRSVAIKVLPREFAENPQLNERFEREARAISQFAHPHICTLHDVGREDGTAYLVLEYLDGETLAERLARGPLPLDQLLRFGMQIADALSRAHRAGIVHRDLKPGNVMLTRDGAKLLDFGLAKEAGGGGAAEAITSLRTEKKSLTEEGTIVGTFQYMAPEQLEGGEADARTDIFALGALLYEMATGRRAFEGKSRASLIAAILTTEPPPIRNLQPAAPAALDRVIRACLQKEPDDRFQNAHDVRLELQWIGEGGAEAAAPARRRIGWAPTAVLLAALIAATAAVTMFVRERVENARRKIVRTAILPPPNAVFDFNENAGPPELSPDGTRLVFAANDGKRRLWIRSLDSTAAQPLSGTEGATFPFWSPDGRHIAYFAGGKLNKIAVNGGVPIVLCEALEGRGGTWSGNTILFGGRFTPIFRVSSSGGTPVAVTDRVPGHDLTHRWPRFLPDGDHFLFLSSPIGAEDARNEICVGSVSKKMRKAVVQASSQPLYGHGYILVVRNDVLIAQRFDDRRLEASGDPIPLTESHIQGSPLFSRSVVTVAGRTLVYQTGEVSRESALVWFDRAGKELSVLGDPESYQTLSLSPDQRRLVVATRLPYGDLWMFDLARGVRTRLSSGHYEGTPLWSPDGRTIVFGSARKMVIDLYLKDVTSGVDRLLVSSDADKYSSSWSPDGRLLFFNTGGDIQYVTIADGKVHTYLATPFQESNGRMSPDGKWVAYQSSESGRSEIYLAPFPSTGEKWRVSAGGGSVPQWRGDGKELFFVDPVTTTIHAVSIQTGPAPQIGTPVPLFRFRSGSILPTGWNVTRDGQRFIVNSRQGEERPQEPLVLVQNFDVALREAAAGSD